MVCVHSKEENQESLREQTQDQPNTPSRRRCCTCIPQPATHSSLLNATVEKHSWAHRGPAGHNTHTHTHTFAILVRNIHCHDYFINKRLHFFSIIIIVINIIIVVVVLLLLSLAAGGASETLPNVTIFSKVSKCIMRDKLKYYNWFFFKLMYNY